MSLTLRSPTNSTLLLSVVLALLLLHGAPGLAQVVETQSVVVRISDLDLNSPDGRKELDRRIHRAARFVCGPSFGTANLGASECAKIAEEKAQRSAEEKRLQRIGRQASAQGLRTQAFDLQEVSRTVASDPNR